MARVFAVELDAASIEYSRSGRMIMHVSKRQQSRLSTVKNVGERRGCGYPTFANELDVDDGARQAWLRPTNFQFPGVH
jgi:hypothetical protein